MKINIKTYYNLKCSQCKTKPLYKDINKNIVYCSVCGLIHDTNHEPIKINKQYTELIRIPLLNNVRFIDVSKFSN